jgi:tetratricopeptide (TPR) repeat protein
VGRRLTVDELRRKVAEDPLSPTFAQLADAYRRRGEFAQAIRICHEGLGHYPAYASGYMVLGRAYQEQGDLAAAREAFRRVLHCDPENVLAYCALGEIAEAENAAADALTAYQNALVFHPFAKDVRAAVARLTPRWTEAPEPAPVAPEPQPQEPAPTVEVPMATETLAHLYAAQGAHDRAADIYARLTADPPVRQEVVRPSGKEVLPPGQASEERPDHPEKVPVSARPEEGLRRLEAWRSAFHKLTTKPKAEPGGRTELLEGWRDAFRRLKPAPQRKSTVDILEGWRDAFRRLKPAPRPKGPVDILEGWRDAFRGLRSVDGGGTR